MSNEATRRTCSFGILSINNLSESTSMVTTSNTKQFFARRTARPRGAYSCPQQKMSRSNISNNLQYDIQYDSIETKQNTNPSLMNSGPDWLIKHGFTSASTQYRLYGRRFLQVWWPNQQCQSTEGGWLVIKTGLNLTRLTSPCYNTTTCMQILYKKNNLTRTK